VEVQVGQVQILVLEHIASAEVQVDPAVQERCHPHACTREGTEPLELELVELKLSKHLTANPAVPHGRPASVQKTVVHEALPALLSQ